MSIKYRATGAVMDTLIRDALGISPYWCYDLEEMRRNYRYWIEDYTDPMIFHPSLPT